jgi:hypothetical protein
MEPIFVGMRISVEQAQKLDQIVKLTGWSRSEILRRLIDGAMVSPPAVTAPPIPKSEPLAENANLVMA